MSKFILDFDLLENEDLSAEELITLIKLYKNDKELLPENEDHYKSLESKGFIKIIFDNHILLHVLREKSKILINSIKLKETDNYKDEESLKRPVKTFNSFEEFVKEYRSLWDGLKPGSMGSKADCNTKMRKWMLNNPDYTQEDILKAAKSYINSVENSRFLQQADYFIYKKDKYTESSRLSAFIDQDEIIEDGWSSSVK